MKRKEGFTLIELLVVIAIVSLLISILIPSLQVAKQQATAIVCMSNLNGMVKSWHLYQQESDAWLVNGQVPRNANYRDSQDALSRGYRDNAWWVNPPHDEAGNYTGDPVPAPLDDEERGIRSGSLFEYTESVDIYHCPGDRNYLKPPDAGGFGRGGKRSYSITGLMNGESSEHASDKPDVAYKFNEITVPGSKLVFLENTDGRGWNMGSWLMNYHNDPPTWVDPLAIFHNDRSTLGFADGHAEKMNWRDNSTIKISEQQTVQGLQPDRAAGEGEDIDYLRRAYTPKR